MRAWSCGKPVEVRNPGSTRPWQHVLEPLSGYLALGLALMDREDVAGEPFNFGPSSDVDAPVLALIDTLAGHWAFGDQVERVRVAGALGLHEAGLLKLNCDKALARLHWRQALDLSETARLTAAWYDAFYHPNGESAFDLTVGQIGEYVNAARRRGLAWAAAASLA